MSTKTIAVDSRVYERLAAVKQADESFSKVIDRLLAELGAAHTGRDILRGLATVEPLSEEEAKTFLEVVQENREGEAWNGRDLS